MDGIGERGERLARYLTIEKPSASSEHSRINSANAMRPFAPAAFSIEDEFPLGRVEAVGCTPAFSLLGAVVGLGETAGCVGLAVGEAPGWAWVPFAKPGVGSRSEEHTSELQSHLNLVCRLLP